VHKTNELTDFLHAAITAQKVIIERQADLIQRQMEMIRTLMSDQRQMVQLVRTLSLDTVAQKNDYTAPEVVLDRSAVKWEDDNSENMDPEPHGSRDPIGPRDLMPECQACGNSVPLDADCRCSGCGNG